MQMQANFRQRAGKGGSAVDNRALIMECAKKLFYAKGYDAVGVQEIVDKAGITKPTLYYYFGSKLGLLKTILKTKFSECNLFELTGPDFGTSESASACVSNESYGGNIREELYKMALELANFFEKDREFYALMMALFYSAGENEAYQVVKPYVTSYYRKVVQTFERAAHQLGNMHGRQGQFAIGFTGTINHFFLMRREQDPEHKEKIEEQQIISLVNQFMYGIFT